MSSFLDRPDESQTGCILNNHPRSKSKSDLLVNQGFDR